ncbi:non-ribosomal peptide synthetase [Solwaraspora sp. WMMB335]|uniref:non-ribosomal peptide synthetase n=1 Tax=Solwaraspora sp. WMMB335 TaxID=3404118 RepID=UPI003B94D5BD
MNRPRDGRLALTPGQRGLWFLHRLDPQDTAFNCCTAIDLVGKLRVSTLRRAVSQVGRWHDTLRTVFVDEPDGPWQTVRDEPPRPRLVDLSGVPAADRDGVARRLIGELSRRPFDLGTDGPARWLLIRLGPVRHLLVLDLHHLIFDRDSLAVICADLTRCYTAGLRGLPPRPRPAGDDAVAAAHGWHLDRPALPVADLDTGGDGRVFAGGGRTGGQPSRYTTRLDGADITRLGRLCAAERATPFMGLLAVVTLLLNRYNGQPSTIVGTPVSLRDGPRYGDVVGLLVNVVPLRLRVDPRQSMRSLLRQARDVVLDALARRAVPLNRLTGPVGPVGPVGPEAGNPSVPVLLTYQTATPAPQLPGLECAVQPVPVAAAKYPLTVAVTACDTGWQLELEADPRYATPAELAAFAQHLATFVRALGRDPDAPTAAVDLLDPVQRAEALRGSSGPRRPQDPTTGLHTLVSAMVRGRPDAVAVVAPTGGDRLHVSYATLWRAAGRLARLLRDRGVGAERTVAVLQPRGIGIPVSYLAILMAGGAVVPLDPDDPDGRIRALLAEAGATVVVTHRPLTDRVAGLGVPSVMVDDVLRPIGGGPTRPPAAPGGPRRSVVAARTHPEQAAYVMFTSGSAGRPKAVVVPHRGIVNRVAWAQEALPLRSAERVLLKTSLAFDVSVPELFWPLAGGGCLVVAEPGGERDPRYLVDLIRLERIGYTHFVPSMLAPFLAEVAAVGDRLASLRTVACSGEALSDELARRAATLLVARLYNLYGPTEASVEVLAWECDRDARIPVAVGRPITNTQCRVVDGRMRPVPAQAVGELALGGACVARGYSARPGLTAESFVPAPGAAGERFYRTGDYGHRGPDGTVHLVGRRDQQIKLLGRRIEPDEVSAALRRQPGILDAAVVGHANRLVAFVVTGGVGDETGGASDETGGAAGDETATRARVLRALRAELPAYLVPAVLEFLPRIPLLRTGKADRAELTRMAGQLTPRGTATAAPRTDLEHILAQAWRTALGRSEIGIHDGFFEAGGDSLALLRLHRQLVGEVAPDLTVRELFRYASVAALAEYLADRPGAVHAVRKAAQRAADRAERRRAAAVSRPRPTGRGRT